MPEAMHFPNISGYLRMGDGRKLLSIGIFRKS